MKIVSFGGGVQSTAIAILAAQGKIEVDAFVFCDTGFEKSIVFEFLEKHTKPMLERVGIHFYTAKTEDYAPYDYSNFSLPSFYTVNTITGDITRSGGMFCSDKWKKNVFRRFLAKQFNQKSYDVIMGFSTDEIHRAGRMKSSKKYNYQFPLLDLRMNRVECIRLVEKTFKQEPPRSSCIFCPNHKQLEWIDIKNNSKDWERLINLENEIMIANQVNGIDKQFITVDCKPIAECDFNDKNEVIFSRLCAGGCFL